MKLRLGKEINLLDSLWSFILGFVSLPLFLSFFFVLFQPLKFVSKLNSTTLTSISYLFLFLSFCIGISEILILMVRNRRITGEEMGSGHISNKNQKEKKEKRCHSGEVADGE
jgi:hypothetical protein